MGVTETGPETTGIQRNPEDFRYHNSRMRPSTRCGDYVAGGSLLPSGETHQVDHCLRQQHEPARRAATEGLGRPLGSALALELELYKTLIDTDDRREGISAFNEKRPPRFKGR